MAKDGILKIIGDQICGTGYLGFAPTSNSTKPAHIANGLFRECTGWSCDTSDLNSWIIDEQKKNGVSSEDIIKKYSSILVKGEKESESKIKEFRYLLNQLFNPDKTAYPSDEFSTYNISSRWILKKRVAAEAGIGSFLYGIIAKDINGKPSVMLDLIQKAMKSGDDNLTALIKPIITFPSDKDPCHKEDLTMCDVKWDKCKQLIREGFDKLAENMHITGEDNNALLVDERVVCFSCFALFFYLANANWAIFSGTKVPIFVDAGTDMESIKKASEKTFTYAKTSVEDYYINTIGVLLEDNFSIKNSDESCLNFLEKSNFNTDSQFESTRKYYETFCKEGRSYITAVAHAMQLALYTLEYKNNSPSDFCRVIGVRAGLVGPKGNRANIKRYIIKTFLLETLALSIMNRDDIKIGIEMKDFCKKLSSAYNILFGCNDEEEYAELEKINITKSTPGDLRGDIALNAKKISDIFISLGLGHRFADGLTILKWR
jgi:hypothetical protein